MRNPPVEPTPREILSNVPDPAIPESGLSTFSFPERLAYAFAFVVWGCLSAITVALTWWLVLRIT